MRKIMYIYDGTGQAEDQRMAFGTLFTFLGDLNSSEVRSRDRFVCHQRDTSALHGFSRQTTYSTVPHCRRSVVRLKGNFGTIFCI